MLQAVASTPASELTTCRFDIDIGGVRAKTTDDYNAAGRRGDRAPALRQMIGMREQVGGLQRASRQCSRISSLGIRAQFATDCGTSRTCRALHRNKCRLSCSGTTRMWHYRLSSCRRYHPPTRFARHASVHFLPARCHGSRWWTNSCTRTRSPSLCL
jgi:hypothetical protein